MFRQFSRFPLRRCLWTVPSGLEGHKSRLLLVAGTSAVAASLVTWSIISENQHKKDLERHSTGCEFICLVFRLGSDLSGLARQNVNSVRSGSGSSPSSIPPDTSPASPLEAPQPSRSETRSAPEGQTTNPSDEASDSEESSGAEGAYNPTTGEINWDCPCLEGMAHGICGPQFREAFSCFVYSEKEPKGIDCIEQFKGMQDCFMEHADVYGDSECL
jgi:intermembrane space import and assembly protein 40